jgi:hypothetical protein
VLFYHLAGPGAVAPTYTTNQQFERRKTWHRRPWRTAGTHAVVSPAADRPGPTPARPVAEKRPARDGQRPQSNLPGSAGP